MNFQQSHLLTKGQPHNDPGSLCHPHMRAGIIMNDQERYFNNNIFIYYYTIYIYSSFI